MALPLIALAFGSCSPGKNQFAPVCPIPGLVRPLAEVSRYSSGVQDERTLIVRARIIDITGICEPGDDKSTIVAKAKVIVDATRGPRMQVDAISLPVFVAVTDSDAIRDKTEFYLPVTFVHNVDTARMASKEVRIEIPITPEKSGAAYGIIAGFQLTPEEVAAWRHDNPR